VELNLIAALSVMGSLTTLWTILKVLIGLGLVIFVHELGHFLVAKACGVKCEKFYLGFDVPMGIGPVRLPRTLAKFQWGETEYGVGIIPLGGYVKMLGQDDNPANAQREAERIRVQKSEQPAGTSAADILPDTEPLATADSGGEFELDPRSFPAKSVPQRMAIISAGVIMNLVFAVIFAAVAYEMGVKYEPCEIGGTLPGSAAWAANAPIGARIIQIGKSGKESDHLRFIWDLQQDVARNSTSGEPQPIEFKLRLQDGATKTFFLTPSARLRELGVANFAMLGLRPPASTTLSKKYPFVPYMAASRAKGPLHRGDRIIGLDGKLFDRKRGNEEGDLPSDELEAGLARHLTEPIKLRVERTTHASETPGQTKTTERDVIVPPNPLRQVGLEMEIGPIEVIRADSPAQAAGFRVGDIIAAVNDQPVGDPLVLSQRFRQWIGQTIDVDVIRGRQRDADRVTLKVQPEAHFQFLTAAGPASLVTIEPMGVAFAVGARVAAVQPGSPAAQAGLRVGDKLTAAQFQLDTPAAQKLALDYVGRGYDKEIELSAKQPNWSYMSDLLQLMPPETVLNLSYLRGDQTMKAALHPVQSKDYYFVQRGLMTTVFQRVHTAQSWSEAWSLGFRETKEQLTRVLVVLKKLVTFELSPKNLGGPLMIAAVAGSEASRGIARLLLFLTFLSANLAILNFLPIPALDGGHMVFLAAEGVTGKPVDERLQITLTLVGIGLLLALMIFVSANDVHRFVKMFF